MSNTAFVVDFGAAFAAWAYALPAMILVLALLSIWGAIKYLQHKTANRPNFKVDDVRIALGNPASTGNVLAEIRALAQKAKDKEAEVKAKADQAEKATKAKAEAEETLAKYRERVALLSAKPAATDSQALQSLESLAAISAMVLSSMETASASFRVEIDAIRGVRNVKGILDVAEKVTGRFVDEHNRIATAVLERNTAERKQAEAEVEIGLANGRVATLQAEVTKLQQDFVTFGQKWRDLAEAGKLGDQKKIAALEAEKGAFANILQLQNTHNGQVVDLAKAAFATKTAGGNQQQGNRPQQGNRQQGNNQASNP